MFYQEGATITMKGEFSKTKLREKVNFPNTNEIRTDAYFFQSAKKTVSLLQEDQDQCLGAERKALMKTQEKGSFPP